MKNRSTSFGGRGVLRAAPVVFGAAGCAFLGAVVIAQSGRPNGSEGALSAGVPGAPGATGECLGNPWCDCGSACGCGSGCACGVELDSPPVGAGIEDYPALRVSLLSRISLPEFDAQHQRGNDCWGYVSPSGREYALFSLDSALAVVEVTDPTAPEIIASVAHEWSVWGDVKTHGEFAYAVNEADDGIQVIDLRGVDGGLAPLVNNVRAQGLKTSHNIAVNNDSGFVYTVGSNIYGGGLIAFNLADPAAPAFAGAWSQRYVHDAQIVTYTEGPFAGRELAFCCIGRQGLAVVDVTNKVQMFALAYRTYPALGYCHQGWLSEDKRYFYVNDELDEVERGIPTTRTIVFDVVDPSRPRYVRTFTSGRPASDHNLYFVDGFIYEANYRSGLRVFNATDQLRPVETGYFDTHPESDEAGFFGAWSVYAGLPSGNVIVSDINRGLFMLDVSAAKDPSVYVPPTTNPGGPRPGLPAPGTTPGGITYFDLPNFGTEFFFTPGAALGGPAPPAPVRGDVNGDGVVDAADLTRLLGAMGGDDAELDLDGDGRVNGADLVILLGAWGAGGG